MDIKGYIKGITTPIIGNFKIHKPLYDYWRPMFDTVPTVYNQEGRPYDFYFIRDVHGAANPYKDTGKYFIWDRYDYGLKTHFYTHKAMLQTMGHPDRKYGMLVESKAIVPKDYLIFKKHKDLWKEFDNIFTFDDEILNDVPNAKFYPSAAGPWYGKIDGIYTWDPYAYQNKSKDISIVSSNKKMCHLHDVRINLSVYCKQNNLADTFGTFDGGQMCLIDDSLKDYRYSIIIENNISDYWFTEKITNCFASQTIPIYLGARKIGDFFNSDGIILITEKNCEDIETVLEQCTKTEYESRLSAILDNYQRVHEYRNMQDYLYEHYLQ